MNGSEVAGGNGESELVVGEGEVDPENLIAEDASWRKTTSFADGIARGRWRIGTACRGVKMEAEFAAEDDIAGGRRQSEVWVRSVGDGGRG